MTDRNDALYPNIVMAGQAQRDPATQGHTLKQRPWVAGSRPAMTDGADVRTAFGRFPT